MAGTDAVTPRTDAAPPADETTTKGHVGPLARLPLEGRARSIVEWFAVAAAVWVLITAVGAIGAGFEAATGGEAEQLFGFAANPMVGLLIGLLATVATQSSSTTTSIVVGMVAGGLPIAIAIPILMGANVGTTMTSTLVSLGAARDREEFRRAFTAASVHDMFNLLAVVIFLPLELAFGLLERLATVFADVTTGTDGGVVATVLGVIGTAVSAVTDPGADLIATLATSVLPPVAAGIAMVVIGIALILLVIRFISAMLKSLLVGKAEQVFHRAIGRGPISGILSGTLITVMVQSSSTTTSLTVPMAASGKFSIWQIYPFVVGANVGTTLTAMIAAFGFSGVEATAATTAAAVHMMYNLLAAALIFGVPFLRRLPVRGATWLGDLAARNKLLVVTWVFGVFLVVPGAILLATVLL